MYSMSLGGLGQTVGNISGDNLRVDDKSSRQPEQGHQRLFICYNSILKFFSLAIRAVLIFQVLHSIRATHNHSVAFS